MRAGVLISAISHVVLVLLALLGTPKLIDGTVPPIMVELVPPDEAPDPPKPEKEKKPAWDLPGEQSAPPPQPAPPAQKQAPHRRSRRRTTAGRRCSSRRRQIPKARLRRPLHPTQSPRSSIRPRSRCCSTCPTCRAGTSTPNRRRSPSCRTMNGRRSGRDCAGAGSFRAPHRSIRGRAWCCASICAATRGSRAIRS